MLWVFCRSDCEEEVIRQVSEHIAKGDNYHILLKIKAKLGYENVFRILYDNLGIKVRLSFDELPSKAKCKIGVI